MLGTVTMTPDQLANLVAAVFEMNGKRVHGLALHDSEGKLVDYAAAVIHYEVEDEIKVYPKPRTDEAKKELDRIMQPYVQPTFAGRNAS